MLTEPVSRVTLSDGSSIHELAAVEERAISTRIFSDPEIYGLELERVFDRVWVFVGHESEIPHAGDFVTRYIGADAVIVTRDEAGSVHVLLNLCSHRGSHVCRAEQGNAKRFRCPYHGWVFSNTGKLVAVPAEKEIFGDTLDKSGLGLDEARVGTYHGLVFATWNHEGPSLEEHLGEMRFYYDMIFGLTDAGLEVAGPPQRWLMQANWKLGADNFSTDNYHTLTTHRSVIDVGLMPALKNIANLTSGTLICDPEHGHSFSTSRFVPDGLPSEEALRRVCAAHGLPAEYLPQVKRRLSPAQLEAFVKGTPAVGNVFPNFGFVNLPLASEIGARPEHMLSIRLWHPKGPDAMEVWSWSLVQKDAPPERKQRARQTAVRTFGSSGMWEQDDGENWSGIQRVIRGVQGARKRFVYYSSTPVDSEWPGPGIARTGFPSEDNQLGFYRRWRTLMTS